MSWMRSLVLAAGSVPLLMGCALFPQGIHPPDSVFVDASLGRKAPPAASGVKSPRASGAASSPDSTSSTYTLADRLEEELLFAWNQLMPEQKTDSAGVSDADENKLALVVLQTGMGVIDHRCGVYFEALGRAAQRMAFASKELNLTTGVVAALQGLTGVAAKDIALSATGLGFLSASSSAYGDVFIFSPDVGSVEQMVIRGQEELRLTIGKMADTEFTRASVISLLQSYENTCEVKTVRRLVNESLASAQPMARFSQGDDPALGLLLQSTRSSAALAIGAPAVTDEQLTALYWLAFKPAPTGNEKTALDSVLATLPGTTAAPAGLLKLREAFRPLLSANLGAAELETRLEKLRAAIAPAPAGAGQNGTPATANAGSQPAPGKSRRLLPSLTLSVLPNNRR